MCVPLAIAITACATVIGILAILVPEPLLRLLAVSCASLELGIVAPILYLRRDTLTSPQRYLAQCSAGAFVLCLVAAMGPFWDAPDIA